MNEAGKVTAWTGRTIKHGVKFSALHLHYQPTVSD